jgi:uncharacterized protein (UPF0332 family)
LWLKYTELMVTQAEEIQQYMKQAEYMLTVAEDLLTSLHFGSSVNRSYYAVFYAATALLLAVGEPRSSHHGVLSAFRQHFIKTERWPVEYSDLYGNLIEDRESSDYMVFVPISQTDAGDALQDARHFVAQAKVWLADEGWL